MTSRNQRQKLYTTAAARRRADPYHIAVDDHEPLRCVDKMDLKDLAGHIARMQEPLPEGMNQVEGAILRLGVLRELIGEFVVGRRDDGSVIEGSDAERWDQVVSLDLDEVLVLRDMMNDLVQEYTGVDPTRQASSSTGSTPTSTPSMDGAPPAASTPSTSPLPAP